MPSKRCLLDQGPAPDGDVPASPLNGAIAVEESPGVAGSNCCFAEEVDAIQASERREIGFATRELLLVRVTHLSAALDQDEGEYGVWGECAEPISPARLHAMPEVQRCVRCQDRLERVGRQGAERFKVQ